MRTPEQQNHLRRLLQNLNANGADVGPVSPPERLAGSFCVAGRPVWLMKTSTMDRACELAAARDPERWSGYSPLAPWRGRRPKRRLIEREYYGLTRAEVRAIDRADIQPLAGDRVAGRRDWLFRVTSLLTALLTASSAPAYAVAPQPVFRDEVFHAQVREEVPAQDQAAPDWNVPEPAGDLERAGDNRAAVAV